jgi:DNA-binding NarL/FixJ family response regulator
MPAARLGTCVHLTKREATCLNSLAQGFSNAEIGVAMKITTGTVKHHICKASTKLDVHSCILLAESWGQELFRIGAGWDGG